MRRDQQRAARSFVAAARLNTHETILDQIHAADGVASADLIQLLDQRNGLHLHTVDRNRNALLETDLDLLFAVGRFLRRPRQLPRSSKALGRIFKLPPS